MRRAFVVAALAAVAALWPAPAQAQSGTFFALSPADGRIVAQARSTVTVTGEMVVTFAGDPTTCAAVGRCETSGSVTWRPPRAADAYLYELQRRRRRSFALTLFPREPSRAETVSQVRRPRPGGGSALCTDARPAPSSLDAVLSRGQVVVGVAPDSAGPLESRCGGPVWADLRYVLPRPRIDLEEFRARGAVADLRTEQTFTAAGLRGTVRSTLVARFTRPRRTRPERDGETEQRQSFAVQTWRVRRVTGSVRIGVRGAPSPVRCAPLDACGLSGTITLTPQVRDGEVYAFNARRPIDGMRFGGGGGWRDAGTATATFTRPGAQAPCIDAVPLEGGSLLLMEEGARVTVTYTAFPGVRSRCAGPTIGSPFASIVSGSVPLRRFRQARRVPVRLTGGAARTVDGFDVSTTSDLALELVRRR